MARELESIGVLMTPGRNEISISRSPPVGISLYLRIDLDFGALWPLIYVFHGLGIA